jgi:hypothetical protein
MASNVWRILPVLPGVDEKRSAPRLVVSVTRASVRKVSEQPAEASLVDLSIYGCRIESPLDHDVGEPVWLRFVGANPIHATIVWSEKGYAGCRFGEPIENRLFRSLTQSMAG